jgi:metal-responsive CopG/Arc/MetJ family transcriptional regulator
MANIKKKRLPLIQVPVDSKILEDFDRLRVAEGKPSRVALARKIIMQHLKKNQATIQATT